MDLFKGARRSRFARARFSTEDDAMPERLRSVRRSLGSFGRGARWMPLIRERTFSRAVGEFGDWWQMYLDQHPYRLITGFLAAGLLAGYLFGRASGAFEVEEEHESTTY